jgi:hypothetical protein
MPAKKKLGQKMKSINIMREREREREREIIMMISLKEEEEDSAKLKRSSSNPICLLKVGPLSSSSSSLSSRLLLNRICKTEKSYTCIAKHNHRHDHERKTTKQKKLRETFPSLITIMITSASCSSSSFLLLLLMSLFFFARTQNI